MYEYLPIFSKFILLIPTLQLICKLASFSQINENLDVIEGVGRDIFAQHADGEELARLDVAGIGWEGGEIAAASGYEANDSVRSEQSLANAVAAGGDRADVAEWGDKFRVEDTKASYCDVADIGPNDLGADDATVASEVNLADIVLRTICSTVGQRGR